MKSLSRRHRDEAYDHLQVSVVIALFSEVINSSSRPYIRSIDLPASCRISWSPIATMRHDGAFLDVTGLTRAAIDMLLRHFRRQYVILFGRGGLGRPTLPDKSHAGSALLLCLSETAASSCLLLSPSHPTPFP